MLKKLSSIFIIGIFSQLVIAMEETPEEQGLKIAQEVDARDSGWGDHSVNVEMILFDKAGNSSSRKMKNDTLEVEGDGDKALVVFKHPKDVRGTALLSYTHKVGSDDQWLYIPTIKRVKRISSDNKSGPFMGSDFAYEDITSQEVERYSYKFIEKNQLDSIDVVVIERTPVDVNSGYKRQIMSVDAERYIPLKIDYFDRKDALLKTQYLTNYKQYGKYWRASILEMVNVQKKTRTVINFTNYSFNNGLVDADFTKSSLKRAK